MPLTSTPSRLALSATALVATVLSGHVALAGGFELPGQGVVSLGRGAAFAVRADDPTAMINNPGGLTRLTGTRLLVNHVLMFEDVTFTRQPTDLPQGFDYGTDPLAPVTNSEDLFALGAMLAITSDFGLDGWTFGVGVFGPHAFGKKQFPVQGGQRYLLTAIDTILAYPSLAVAYGDDDVFGVGLTLQYVMAPRLEMSIVADASQSGQLHAYHSQNDVIANLDMSDNVGFSAIAGAWWRVIPELELGISGRIVPVDLELEGDLTLDNVPGQSQFTAEQLIISDSAASMDLTLPPTFTLGARYRHLDGTGDELFDLELNFVWELWSFVEAFDIDLEGEINLFAKTPAPDTTIDKRWRDTYSVQLGGTLNPLEGLSLSLGAYWERGAVPNNYEHLDFLSFDRVGLSLGVSGAIGPVRLSVALNHVVQQDRVVSERYSKVYQVRPIDRCPQSCDFGAGWDGVPANAGRFESSYTLLATGVDVAF